MKTVIASLKGGSGKSTLSFNLGVWLASSNTIAIYDLDPQATLSDVLEIREEDGYEPEIQAIPVTNATFTRSVNTQNKKVDEILMDVSVSEPHLFDKALKIADRVVVPVPPSQADVWSLQRFLDRIAKLAKGKEILVFINRGDTHRAVRETAETAEALAQLSGIQLLEPRLSQRTAFRRAFSEGLAVYELEPRGKAAEEFLALAEVLYPE
ncbi:MAG: nucleotide-binding protein [bacterium]